MDKNKIVQMARDRMSEAVDADRENRRDALDDLENLSGDGIWPKDVRQEREAAKRPVITINRLPQFVRQVTGDIRKLNPAIKVLAGDDKASNDVAEIIRGMIRGIEYDCGASAIYEASAESAAQCGMGAFRVRADYESEDGFEQVLKIERIHNPFATYWDAAAREPTRSDAEFCFITEQMRKEDFERSYPKATFVDAEHDSQTDGIEHWHDKGSTIVAEHYWKEYYTADIHLLPDGTSVEELPDGTAPVRTRKARRHKVMWAKVTGAEILEGPKEIPGKHIPVVAVMGEEMHVGDRLVRTSVIRFAKDPQRVYCYAASTQTEVVSLQPKSPFIGTISQFKGLETVWSKANTSTAAFLPYNPDPKAPGAPQRSTPPVSSQGLTQELLRAADDMKATTGIYDAGLGQRSNEQSGVAIRQRQMESDVSTSVYTDNLAKSIEHCGRILVDAIPRVYDTQRNVRVIGDDDSEDTVPINVDAITPTGERVVMNDLALGRYNVRVSVGPNYATRRQETQDGMLRFIQAYPQAAAITGDLIAKSQDWPDADQFAKRLKKALPPGLIDPSEMDEEEQQGALQEAAQIIQQLQAQIQQMAQAPEMRKAEAEATEAEAEATEAQADAMLKQLEVSAQTGAINAAIQQAVQQALLASLQQGYFPQ